MTNYDQSVYDTAISQGFNATTAKLIAAQARYESADYSSHVFKENNNTSGIKFIGQPNAVKGLLSPEGNYYAKFNTVQDGINDKIVRLYNITMGGVTPEQLKNSTDALDFATKLKKRNYFGQSAELYAVGLNTKLLKINVIDFVQKNKYSLGIGLILIGIAGYAYLKSKK